MARRLKKQKDAVPCIQTQEEASTSHVPLPKDLTVDYQGADQDYDGDWVCAQDKQECRYTKKEKYAYERKKWQAERIEYCLKYGGQFDLHDFNKEEAIAALNKIMSSQKRDDARKHIVIVTGQGNHSLGGIPIIRPAVIEYLKENDYRYVAEEGSIKVTLKNK